MNTKESKGIRAVFTRDFGGFSLKVDLDLPAQGVTILFGGSGSGKTTLLRCVAGLEPEARGYLAVNGEVWQDDAAQLFIPTHQRPIGYVFQDAALFQHLNVQENLEFGLKRIPASERRTSFEQAVDLLGIRPLLERYPIKLSGGEQQRAAMARALLTSPRLLLMDEPLAALDVPLKREILPYLERLHDELEIPILYVTHSPDELARLGDYLVLLAHNGKLVGQGPLQEMLGRLDYLSAFADDPGIVLDTRVSAHDKTEGLTRLIFEGGSILVSLRTEAIGSRVRCRVLPTDVSLTLTHAEDTSILNILAASIVGVGETHDPTQVMVQLDVGGTPLLARITRRSSQRLGIAPGLPVYAQIKAVAFLD